MARAKLEKLQKESKDRISLNREEDEKNQKIRDARLKKDDDEEKEWMIKLAKLAEKDEDLSQILLQERERNQVLKEIEIEQKELYERYKVERTMQAEEY